MMLTRIKYLPFENSLFKKREYYYRTMFEWKIKYQTEIFTVTPIPWSNEVIISQFTILGRKGCKLAFFISYPDKNIIFLQIGGIINEYFRKTRQEIHSENSSL